MSLEVVSTIFSCHCSHIAITAAVLLLLLLSYHCYFHITPVASAFPGAAELTTQLLRLISILYLPLCRINKFGFYFPRRLLRSPILVGHHRQSAHSSVPAVFEERTIPMPIHVLLLSCPPSGVTLIPFV